MINPVSNALSNSLSGLMNASKKLDTAVNNIANAGSEGSNVNLDEEIINTVKAKNDYESNAVVLTRTNNMQKVLGQLLDETA